MIHKHWLSALALALLAGGAPAQEEEDEPSIEVDTAPKAADEPEEPDEAQPSAPAGAAPARAKGAKPKWVEVKDKSGRFTMKVPDDWRLSPEEPGRAAFAYDVRLPGSRLAAWLMLDPVERLGDPRRGPHRFREDMLTQLKATRHEAGYDPVPHLVVYRDKQGTPYAVIWAFVSFSGHGFYLRLECTEADFAQARPDLLAVAASLEAQLEPAHPVPDNYDTSSKGMFLLARHPSVTAPTDHMLKIAARQAKAFRRIHGAPPKREEPALIFVHNDKFQAKPILAAVADSKHDSYVDDAAGRIFVKPAPKGDTTQESVFAGDVWALLFALRYGDSQPVWVRTGECLVARAEYQTGKRLPHLDAGYAAWRSQDVVLLDHLAVENWEPFFKSSFLYVATLRAGPAKYRKLYKAFLADLAKTPNPDAMLEKHFKPLDQAEFRNDVREWVWAKIKEVRTG